MNWSNDNWKTKIKFSDKILHLLGALVGIQVFMRIFNLWLSIALVLLACLIKELWDSIRADGFSIRDLIADFFGILIGIWLIS